MCDILQILSSSFAAAAARLESDLLAFLYPNPTRCLQDDSCSTPCCISDVHRICTAGCSTYGGPTSAWLGRCADCDAGSPTDSHDSFNSNQSCRILSSLDIGRYECCQHSMHLVVSTAVCRSGACNIGQPKYSWQHKLMCHPDVTVRKHSSCPQDWAPKFLEGSPHHAACGDLPDAVAGSLIPAQHAFGSPRG